MHAQIRLLSDDDHAHLLPSVRQLMLDYKQHLVSFEVPIDEFQGYSEEIAALPGKYVASKGGCIYLASKAPVAEDSTPLEPVGCIAVRDLGPMTLSIAGKEIECKRVAELKRLYVVPAARGHGVASSLTNTAMAWITGHGELGYDAVVLDTLHRLPGALQLYKKLGFSECGPYCRNPMHDVVFLAKLLS